MKTSEEIKMGLIDAIEEASWVVEGGDAHDLIDAVEKAHASMADALAYIRELEITHRTEYCDEADYDCIALGNARKRIAELEDGVAGMAKIIESAYKQRDAAIEDLRGRCFACAHVRPHEKFPKLNGCQYVPYAMSGQGARECEHWKWRGAKE